MHKECTYAKIMNNHPWREARLRPARFWGIIFSETGTGNFIFPRLPPAGGGTREEKRYDMIRNIVFDMGNVLIRFEPALFMTREGVTRPEDRELLQRELFRSLEWAMMDRGDLREETAEPLILARLPEHLKDPARRLLYDWSDPGDAVAGMEELAERLKAAGYRVYLLSNASVRQHVYWPHYSVSRLMDGTLISADVRTVKPCPEIYEAFLRKFALKGEECLFIDDAAMNVAGAIGCGWEGIVFHGSAAELEEQLRKKGIFC